MRCLRLCLRLRLCLSTGVLCADNFRAGHSVGTILKKNCTREAKCLIELMDDPLREFAPLFYRELDVEGTSALQHERERVHYQ